MVRCFAGSLRAWGRQRSVKATALRLRFCRSLEKVLREDLATIADERLDALDLPGAAAPERFYREHGIAP